MTTSGCTPDWSRRALARRGGLLVDRLALVVRAIRGSCYTRPDKHRLYTRGAASAPFRRTPALNTLQKLCSGSLPISAAFWGFLIGGGAAVLFAVGVIGGVTVIAYPAARIPVYVTGFIVLWAYLILACFVTWRSASATKTGPLRIAAKVVVILLAVWFLFSLSRVSHADVADATRNGVAMREERSNGSYLQWQLGVRPRSIGACGLQPDRQ